MTAINNNVSPKTNDWQSGFVALLPEIQQRLDYAFRHRNTEARDDATTDGIAHALLAYRRLYQRHRVEVATATNLAWCAIRQVEAGRVAGNPLNSREPLSLYAQRRRAMSVVSLQTCTARERAWIDRLANDHRVSVIDQVAARLDVAAWLATFCRRTRQIASDLAHGCTTSEVARKYGVTASRISQLRRELARSWQEFQHEPERAASA